MQRVGEMGIETAVDNIKKKTYRSIPMCFLV